MPKHKIAIFSTLYMPHLGGVEKFSQSIAAELSKDSQVTVFCMNTENQPDHTTEGEVEVFFLPCFPLQKGRFPIPKPSALRILRQQLRKDPPDFAIVQCRFYVFSFLACHILHRYRIPFIQIDHGAGELTVPNPVIDRIWHVYDAFVTRSEMRLPHDYYGVSYAGLRWLEHYGIHGSGVISNSIAPKDFTEALANPGKWRKAHGIPEQAVLITFSGRVMREKGITDLLEAFDSLQRDGVHLVVAGGGDMEIVRPWQCRDNIHFLGQIDFSDIPFLLSDTQIFCLPSRFIEGKPTGVLEAGYCRNAVIASNSGGTTEIIPDERYGELIPTGDIPALAEALRYYIDHPEEREKAGQNLHDRILENFTWETAADEVRKAMAKACS